MLLPIPWDHNSINSGHGRNVRVTKPHKFSFHQRKINQKIFAIKSKILSIARLNKVHLSLSAGYMIILKSSNKHQAKSHHDLTMSSYAYIASLRFSLVSQHTPSKSIQSHLPHPSIKLKMKILQPHSHLSQTPFHPMSIKHPSCMNGI